MALFNDPTSFIESATEICDKIVRIDSVINALLIQATEAATNSDVEQYTLDDGQTSIRVKHRSPEDLQKSIEAFEKLKIFYSSKINGRITRVRTIQRFSPNGFY